MGLVCERGTVLACQTQDRILEHYVVLPCWPQLSGQWFDQAMVCEILYPLTLRCHKRAATLCLSSRLSLSTPPPLFLLLSSVHPGRVASALRRSYLQLTYRSCCYSRRSPSGSVRPPVHLRPSARTVYSCSPTMASKRCQKKDRGDHKLVCGKTRSEVDAAYRTFCESDVA